MWWKYRGEIINSFSGMESEEVTIDLVGHTKYLNNAENRKPVKSPSRGNTKEKAEAIFHTHFNFFLFLEQF